MKMTLLNHEQLTTVYHDLLVEAFPAAELKPLSAMEDMMAKGNYLPYGFFQGDAIVGACFLWLGQEHVLLLDYLCIAPTHRNQGLGEEILSQLRKHYPNSIILAESEYPPFAPDPAMAERRLGFYRRNQAQTANFRGRVFGVVYTIFYWGDTPTQEQYRYVYQNTFSPEKMEQYVQIPDHSTQPSPKVDWTQ